MRMVFAYLIFRCSKKYNGIIILCIECTMPDSSVQPNIKANRNKNYKNGWKFSAKLLYFSSTANISFKLGYSFLEILLTHIFDLYKFEYNHSKTILRYIQAINFEISTKNLFCVKR